jgi:hypothetical protein
MEVSDPYVSGFMDSFCFRSRVSYESNLGFFVCRVAQGAIQHTSCCEGCTVLYAESVASADRDKLVALLDKLLRKAQTRKKEKRSAATNQQGHQKTPAFIHALLKDAINKLENDDAVEGEEVGDEDKMPRHKPEGGFTDVGLHTGGHPRDTSWPLAREAFKVRVVVLALEKMECVLRCVVLFTVPLKLARYAIR